MSSWRPAGRSDQAAAVYAAAEADRVARPDRYRLDPDHVASIASRQTDDSMRFADGWREGLEQYLASASEDGRLNALGARMVVATALGRLRGGAAMARYREAARPLMPPIVITGGWRTGTTFLFRLLATDPRLRAPLPSELTDPCRVAGLSGDERDAFIDASAAAHDMLHMLNPQLRAIHDSGARLPEECVLGMGTDLRNWGFTSTVRLDGYARWLGEQDLAGSYVRYRHLLQVLDRGDGRRWVLKAPAHTAELPHVVGAFPGAVIVHLRRDIVETIASGASLFAVFRSTYSDDVDAADVGRFQVEQTERWFRRAAAYRTDPSSKAATFVDLEYTDLVRDPVTAIAAVYAAAGMDPPADPAAFVAAYHEAHSHHAHGAHRYTVADFGLDDRDIRERFAFLDR